MVQDFKELEEKKVTDMEMDKGFAGLLDDWQTARKEIPAFCFWENGEERTVTFGDWVSDVCRFASRLKVICGSGSMPGENTGNIGLAAANCYEWFVAFYGIILSGKTVVSLNRDLPGEELMAMAGSADTMLVLADRELMEYLGETDSRLLSLEDMVRESRMARDGEGKERAADFSGDPDSAAFILYSSGTSGVSKGVMLSQRNIMTVLLEPSDEIRGGRFLLSLPMHHIAGIQISLMYLAFGVTIFINSSIKYLIRDIFRFTPSIMSVVPIQLDLLASKIKKDRRLRETAAACLKSVVSLGAPLMNEYEEIFSPLGIQILNAYGLTETSGYINSWHPHRKGSVGRILSRNKFRLEEGEILVKGPSVMLGYYKNRAATELAIRDGWFYTGDLGRLDEEGFLYLTGRKKNTIILANGENVSPEELEQKLFFCPYVKEVIVSGSDGQITAIVYLGDCGEEARREVKAWVERLNRQEPTYRQIRRIHFRDTPFEKTGSGKIKRKERMEIE